MAVNTELLGGVFLTPVLALRATTPNDNLSANYRACFVDSISNRS